MKTQTAWVSLLVVVGLGHLGSGVLHAAVTADHKKQITEVTKETTKASGLISKKDYDEAAKLLNDAEKKLKQIAKEADIKETDKLIAAPLKKIATTREQLEKKRPSGGAAGRWGERPGQGPSNATSLPFWWPGASIAMATIIRAGT